MAYLKPELIAEEVVLREYGCTVYMVRNGLSSRGSNVRLWLTNMRLILKAGFGPQRTLPLHAIVDVREEKIGFYNMARIEFAGGHLEWFTVQDQTQFLAALQAARSGAPVVPVDAAPVPVAGQSGGQQSKAVIAVVVILAAAILVCVCIAILAIGGYMFYVLPR
jgi:hypothetical protein